MVHVIFFPINPELTLRLNLDGFSNSSWCCTKAKLGNLFHCSSTFGEDCIIILSYFVKDFAQRMQFTFVWNSLKLLKIPRFMSVSYECGQEHATQCLDIYREYIVHTRLCDIYVTVTEHVLAPKAFILKCPFSLMELWAKQGKNERLSSPIELQINMLQVSHRDTLPVL